MEEVSVAVAILPQMVEGRPLSVRVSANMALFTLGCRNGLVVCTAEGVWEAMQSSSIPKMLMEEASSGIVSVGALDLSASGQALYLLICEVLGKCPSASRGPLEAAVSRTTRINISAAAKALSDENVLMILSVVMERKYLQQDDLSLASGSCVSMGFLLYARPHLAAAVESMGIFNAAWQLHQRVMPKETSDTNGRDTASIQ